MAHNGATAMEGITQTKIRIEIKQSGSGKTSTARNSLCREVKITQINAYQAREHENQLQKIGQANWVDLKTPPKPVLMGSDWENIVSEERRHDFEHDSGSLLEGPPNL